MTINPRPKWDLSGWDNLTFSDGTIQAIQTPYHGRLFRSRTEARWAVFFDALGLHWQYEPKERCVSGINYLPDFYLQDLHCFFEVKGPDPEEWYRERLLRFAHSAATKLYMAVGCVPELQESHDASVKIEYFGLDRCGSQKWCECQVCGRVGITHLGDRTRLGCGCLSWFPKPVLSGNSPRLNAAYATTKLMRFEEEKAAA